MDKQPDQDQDKCAVVAENKALRHDLDALLQALKQAKHRSRERALAMTKIQEAIMWLGMDLKVLNGDVSCYRHGYNAASPIVEPTADGVKL